MKKLMAITCVGLLAACDQSDVSRDNAPNLRTLSAAEIQVAAGTNDFAFNLFRNIQKETPENNFISPLSVSIALAMTLNGAAGDTQQGILNTIDFGDFSADEINQGYKDLTALLLSMDKKVKLGIANSVWYSEKYHVKESFADKITTYYDGVVTGLNFGDAASKNKINNWVENKTNGRIKDLINNISQDEVMFLVNAIYFKGDWTYQFDKSKTKKANFKKIDGTTAPVDMMFSSGVKMLHYYANSTRLLDIPYGNKQFSLTLLVPDNPEHITNLVSSLDMETFNYWLSQADSLKPEFEMPKFKMTWKDDLLKNLKTMGMPIAGFPNLFKEDLDLAISRVIHQSFLDINEEGTEAAAATAVGIELTSAPSQPVRITVDRPFVFMIREKHTGAILFVGQLIDPVAL